MYCMNCGKKISEHSVFCPFCGTALSASAAAGSQSGPGPAPASSTRYKASRASAQTGFASASRASAQSGFGSASGAAAMRGFPPVGPGYAQPVNQSPIQKTHYNLMCILGVVISLISLFFNYFGLVGLGGTIVSVIGLVLCSRRQENGRILGVIGVLFGVTSIVTAVLAML